MAIKTVPQNRKHGVHAEIVNVTPKLAAEWLQKNVNNRPVRQRIVDTYARDMEAGAWQITGESIKFNSSGELADGQHRLCAVVKAQLAVPMLVVRGVDPSSQTVMDSGAKRTSADALALSGHKYVAMTAAGAKLAINWQAGYMKSARAGSLISPTHAEVLEFVEANPDIENAAELVSLRWRHIPARGSVIVFTSWVCMRIDLDQAVQFFDDLSEMRTDGIGDPRQALLARLRNATEMRQRMSQTEQSDAFFRAWNAVRAGQRLSRINPRNKDGNFMDPR